MMSPIGKQALTPKRLGALLAVALLIVGPIVYIAWSLHAAGLAAETIRSQSDILTRLQSRAASLRPEDVPGAGEGESVLLPGETPALAGAALQRIVADAVEAAGGRVIETEIARVQTTEEEDPGRVDLRVSFDADIVSLQAALLQLETGLPVLLIRSLDVQSAAEATEAASPPLRVLMLVGGYAETPA